MPFPRPPILAAVLFLLLLLVIGDDGAAAAKERLALFDFELINTSLEPTRPDEQARLAGLAPLARERMAAAGYKIVDTAPVATEIANLGPLKNCNGCELKLARELGADLAALGWVQKVSNLILNINLQVREVATGRLVKAGTVDIRGNTDESWQRGARYLLDHRILPGGS